MRTLKTGTRKYKYQEEKCIKEKSPTVTLIDIFHNILDIGMGMALFKANGHCSIGYYNTLGINDLQSCFSLCLKDAACQYVSYLPKSTCSLYKYGQCGIVSSTTYNTYRKVQKGKILSLF